LADLGRWLSGDYLVAGQAASGTDRSVAGPLDGTDDESDYR
jgi:endogenous inhibitor of DNA gyrase (YacG/DUF329 family)